MSELKEKITYSENDDKLIVQYSQDLQPYRDENKRLKADCKEHGAYMGQNLVHACKVPEILIIQMRNGTCCPDGIKYDMLAADPEEARRALLHIQSYHNDAIIIRGKPFAKKRAVWS